MNFLFQRGLGSRKSIVLFSQKTASLHLYKAKCPVKLQPGTSSPTVLTCRTLSYGPTKKSIGGMGIFLLVIPFGTFCLGTWQVQRRKWKLDLIANLEARTSAAPVDFPQELTDLDDLEYQKVKLRGSFDHSREVLLGPRPLLVSGDVHQSGSGLISSGQSGYLVITPFKLADRDLTVLVNRGWVPRKQKAAETREGGQVEGLVHLTAVVRKTEPRAPFMPENSKNSTVFLYRDVPTMSRMLTTAPIFLDAVDTFPGGPQGGQTRVTMRNEHFSYMLTWYSLSLATTYLWYRRFILGKALV